MTLMEGPTFQVDRTSILLGVDTAEAAKMFRDRFGYRAVRGVYDREVRTLLEEEGGYKVTMTENYAFASSASRRPTLNMWLNSDLEDGMYFVLFARHFAVINVRGNRRYYNDNRVMEWVNARTDKGVKRRGRVLTVWKVEK